MRILLVILCAAVVGLGLVVYGLGAVVRQHRLLAGAEAVPGEVVLSEVVGAEGQLHRPRIVVRYRVGGSRYESDRLAPWPMTGSRTWAESVVAEHRPGRAVDVYVDEARPGAGFVLKQSRFGPYGFVLAGSLLLAGLAWPVRTGAWLDADPAAVHGVKPGWYELPAERAAGGQAAVALAVAAGLALVAALAAIHYLAVLGRPWDPMAAMLIPYAVAPVVAAGLGLRAWRSAAALDAPRVLSSREALKLDAPAMFRVELRPRRGTVDVAEARATLVCERRAALGRRELFRASETLLAGRSVGPGDGEAAECRFDVPPRKRRAGKAWARWRLPRVVWSLEVMVRLGSGVTQRVRYPVRAELG